MTRQKQIQSSYHALNNISAASSGLCGILMIPSQAVNDPFYKTLLETTDSPLRSPLKTIYDPKILRLPSLAIIDYGSIYLLCALGIILSHLERRRDRRKYLRTYLMWPQFFFCLSEIKDMRKWIPQISFCQKSMGLFSSASEHSSCQCLHKIRIDWDLTHVYWLALQFFHAVKKKRVVCHWRPTEWAEPFSRKKEQLDN